LAENRLREKAARLNGGQLAAYNEKNVLCAGSIGLLSDAGLFTGGGILMQNPFGNRLVKLFDRHLIGGADRRFVPSGHSRLKFLQTSLESRFGHFILKRLFLIHQNPLFCGFDIWQKNTSLLSLLKVTRQKLRKFTLSGFPGRGLLYRIQQKIASVLQAFFR